MKKVLISLVGLVALAGCATSQQTGTLAGAAVGAATGKVLGGQGGAVIGTVLGAAAGSNVGAAMDAQVSPGQIYSVAPNEIIYGSPTVVYVRPWYSAPGPYWRWSYHSHYGWGWYHPRQHHFHHRPHRGR